MGMGVPLFGVPGISLDLLTCQTWWSVICYYLGATVTWGHEIKSDHKLQRRRHRQQIIQSQCLLFPTTTGSITYCSSTTANIVLYSSRHGMDLCRYTAPKRGIQGQQLHLDYSQCQGTGKSIVQQFPELSCHGYVNACVVFQINLLRMMCCCCCCCCCCCYCCCCIEEKHSSMVTVQESNFNKKCQDYDYGSSPLPMSESNVCILQEILGKESDA